VLDNFGMQACVPAFGQRGGSSASTLSSVVLGPAVLGPYGLIQSSRASFLSCDAMLMGIIILIFRNGNSFQCDAGESIRPRDVPGMLVRHKGRSQIWRGNLVLVLFGSLARGTLAVILIPVQC